MDFRNRYKNVCIFNRENAIAIISCSCCHSEETEHNMQCSIPCPQGALKHADGNQLQIGGAQQCRLTACKSSASNRRSNFSKRCPLLDLPQRFLKDAHGLGSRSVSFKRPEARRMDSGWGVWWAGFMPF